MQCLRVYNKADLTSQLTGKTRRGEQEGVTLSAKTGEGISDLRAYLAVAIGWQTDGEGVYLARARHLDALRQAQTALSVAGEELRRQELFAENLRLAHEALMLITGKLGTEDLLGEIFSRFCIGK